MFAKKNTAPFSNQDSLYQLNKQDRKLTAPTNKMLDPKPADKVKYFGGRAFSHESWLHIPTFLRQGKRIPEQPAKDFTAR